jgi:hypothetical protein
MKHQVRNPSCHSVWPTGARDACSLPEVGRLSATQESCSLCALLAGSTHAATGPPAKPRTLQYSPEVTQQAAPGSCALSPSTQWAQPCLSASLARPQPASAAYFQ